MKLFASLVAAVVLLPTPAHAKTAKPAEVAQRFYAAYLALHPPGLPSGDALKTLEPFLSHRLRGLIDAALEEQARFAKAHPDDKPPFVDGDYFSSNFEGFTAFKVGKVESRGAAQRVEMELSYSDPGAEQRVEWKDALTLAEEDGRLVIDDVELLGDWPFATHGKLSEILAEREN